jgi:hypothetical protein
VWDAFQIDRLKFEQKLLEENHPDCEFNWSDNSGVVKIWHRVEDSWYKLRIYVPGSYPDEKPRVFVEYPSPLPAYWSGRKISDFAPNHNYHVLTTSSNGEVQICHFSDDVWDASKSIHLVVLKAKLWLQAYTEHHLKTGKPICDFFNDCL